AGGNGQLVWNEGAGAELSPQGASCENNTAWDRDIGSHQNQGAVGIDGDYVSGCAGGVGAGEADHASIHGQPAVVAVVTGQGQNVVIELAYATRAGNGVGKREAVAAIKSQRGVVGDRAGAEGTAGSAGAYLQTARARADGCGAVSISSHQGQQTAAV